FSPSKVHARGIIAITSSLIEYLLAKLLSFQGFIVLFGVGSLSINNKIKTERRKGYGYPDDEYFFLRLMELSRKAS
ncbi:hypothetical protein J7U02_08255, partial [Lactobacillus delbrueckii subsp. lactis]|nr:hypothetical protein [Lactobacillus delbrueckii subsp. lactis]